MIQFRFEFQQIHQFDPFKWATLIRFCIFFNGFLTVFIWQGILNYSKSATQKFSNLVTCSFIFSAMAVSLLSRVKFWFWVIVGIELKIEKKVQNQWPNKNLFQYRLRFSQLKVKVDLTRCFFFTSVCFVVSLFYFVFRALLSSQAPGASDSFVYLCKSNVGQDFI